jgi:hypothetical protein
MRLQLVGAVGTHRAAERKGIPRPGEFVAGAAATRRRHRCLWEEFVASWAWPRPLVTCMRLKKRSCVQTVGGHEILPTDGHVTACRWPSELSTGGQWFCPR